MWTFNYLANEEDYLDYLIATQNGWYLLGYLTSRKQFIRVFEALEHKEIISLKIGSRQYDHVYDSSSLQNEDLFILARSMASKTSFKRIHLHHFPGSNADRGMCALFESLSTCPNLREMKLTHFSFPTTVFQSFLDFLRRCTSLQDLIMTNMDLNDDQVENMMQALEENHQLTNLDLGNNNGCTSVSAFKLANFLKNRKNSIYLNTPTYLSLEEAKEFFTRLGDNTSLTGFRNYENYRKGDEIIQRNRDFWDQKEKSETKEEVKEAPKPLENETKLIVSAKNGSDVCNIITMPEDIMNTILYQIDIKSMVQLRKSCKYFNGMFQQSKFWRDYYLKYFAVIPKDVLEISDYVYGVQLSNNSQSSSDPSFWELIFRYSALLRPIPNSDFPINLSKGDSSPIMNEIYRNFPQLIGTYDTRFLQGPKLPPNQHFLTKKSPYGQYWYLLFVSSKAVYHLGFEQDGNDQFNAILLFTEDFSATFSERFKYLKYIFEWTTAKNEKELQEKAKLMIEIFLNARLQFSDNPSREISTKPNYEKIVKNVIEKRRILTNSLNSKLQAAAEKSWSDLRIDLNNTAQFCRMIEKFKTMIDQQICSSEFMKLKQRMIPRSSLANKYRNHHDPFVFDFEINDFIREPTNSKPKNTQKTNSKKRRTKIHGQVALTTFYRTMINFIVMPILELLWMDSPNDPDYLYDPHYRLGALETLYKQLFARVTLTRFSDVSVHRAHPSNWPVTALAVANQIVEPLVSLLQDVICSVLSKSESRRGQDLVPNLQQQLNMFNGLLPQPHINAVIQVMRNFRIEIV